jgi:hypothetical protein
MPASTSLTSLRIRRISGLRGLHGTADALQILLSMSPVAVTFFAHPSLDEEFASRRSLAESRSGKRKANDPPDDRNSKKQYTVGTRDRWPCHS